MCLSLFSVSICLSFSVHVCPYAVGIFLTFSCLFFFLYKSAYPTSKVISPTIPPNAKCSDGKHSSAILKGHKM